MKPTTKVLGCVAAIASMSTGSPAWAQSTSAAGAGAEQQIEEIVVTTRFKEEAVSSSMKSGISVRDTPFSLESYSNSFMQSIATVEVADLYRYMTGLQKAGITGYDLTIRGFSTIDSDRNTFLTDGLPGLSVRFGSPPTIGTDHIELVKGAASLLYGQAQPGGFVNIITKKPQMNPLNAIELRGTNNASDYSHVHGGAVSIDSTGPVAGSDHVLYRLVAQLSDDNRFHTFSYERGQYVVPSVTVNLGDATSLTTQFEYRSAKADYENVALLAPRTAVPATVAQLPPIQTNYTFQGSNRDERGTTASLFVNHHFANGAAFALSARSVDHHDYAYAFDVTGFDRKDPTFQTLALRARGQSNQRTYNFADANLVWPFATGSIGHRVIIGLDYGKEIDDFARTKFCAINSPGSPRANPSCNLGTNQYTLNVLRPDFSAIPPVSAFGPGALADNYIVSKDEGAYLSDLATLTEQWKVLAGLRYSRSPVTANINRYDPTQPYFPQTSSSVLPQAGLIYQPDKRWSYYASYSTSFTPVDPSTQALTTAPTFKPTKGYGYELGAKASLLQERMEVTGAVFRIDQKNVLAPYANGVDQFCPTGSCQIQVGAARSKGVELELDAKPVDALTLIAGYAYTDARITESSATGPIVGHVLPDSPFNAFHLWSRWDFLAGGALHGFGVGLGYSYVSSRVAMTGIPSIPGEFNLPSYQVVDLGLYKIFSTNLDMTLKVNNLFDKRYYQDGKIVAGMVSVDAGVPRTAELYLRARF